MKNVAMSEALITENLSVKKELEDLRKEVRSTYRSNKIPYGIDRNKEAVVDASQASPDSPNQKCS